MAEEILLESGTNEAEFLEFYLGEQSFGVNVAKIVQIIQFLPESLTVIPNGPDSLLGSYLWRGQTVDLIDLNMALFRTEKQEGERDVVLVTTFNDIITAFYINGVNRIHRANWEQIQSMDQLLSNYNPRFTGTLVISGKNILLVDFEKLVFELNPDLEKVDGTGIIEEQELQKIRNGKTILFAEDSGFIRKNITRFLKRAGYNVLPFENGQKAFDAIQQYIREAQKSGIKFSDKYHALLTDIEMPQMDGLTLCRHVKKKMKLDIPVLIFSSLIDEQMKVKCQDVGADNYIAKPRTPEMIQLVDKLVL
ncbi:chemotaxis protein [bacterium]|nr:chemotaxis protein [bacterium]